MIADHWTEEQRRRFIIADNVGFGEWSWEDLANEWDAEQLAEWGLDFPGAEVALGEKEQDQDQDEEQAAKWVPDCAYLSNNLYDIPTLLMDLQGSSIQNPCKPYGADSRDKKGVGTYHFYVDDYRFESIWDKPNNIVDSGCLVVVEPNLSLYNTTPISYGLFLLFKKRWIARYLQSFNIEVFVDLNVNPKFAEYNLLGVPEGWNAYATRGYTDRIEDLTNEYKVAQRHSGKEEPLFVIYGGGRKCQEFSAKHNCIYIEQFKNGSYNV